MSYKRSADVDDGFWRPNSSMQRIHTSSWRSRFQNLSNDSRTIFNWTSSSNSYYYDILASAELKFGFFQQQRKREHPGWWYAEGKPLRGRVTSQWSIPQSHNFWIALGKICCKRKRAGRQRWSHQSSMKENHAKKLQIQTEPVYNFSEKVIPIEESKWNDIPACQQFRGNTFEAEFSKLVMRLVRRYDQHERETDGAVYWKSMSPKLRKASQKAGGRKFSDSGFSFFYKGSAGRTCLMYVAMSDGEYHATIMTGNECQPSAYTMMLSSVAMDVEQRIWAAKTLCAHDDDVAIWKLIRVLGVWTFSGALHFVIIPEQLFLHIAYTLTFCCSGEGVPSLREDLHQVLCDDLPNPDGGWRAAKRNLRRWELCETQRHLNPLLIRGACWSQQGQHNLAGTLNVLNMVCAMRSR